MRLAAGLGLALFLAVTPSWAQSPPDPSTPDLRALYTTGALSPDYPRLHPTSTAPLLPLADDGKERPTFFTLQVNPALFFVGVWSVRAELALVPYLSVMGEYSRLRDFAVPYLPEVRLDANLIDVGLHFWPQGNGARGVYLGPRLSFGEGSDRNGYGEGKLSGWGADIGYQWIAGIFAFNLGVGLGRGVIEVTTTDATRTRTDLPEELHQPSIKQAFPRPYLTIGVGLGF